MQSWFVYYKVPRGDEVAAIARSQRIAGAVAALTGEPPRVLRKLDTTEVATVMEIYAAVRDPAHFDAALTQAAHAEGLSAAALAARRVERFECCAV